MSWRSASSAAQFHSASKYVAFGRELNVHIRTDFSLYLPAVMDDEDRMIPDWEWMDDFMSMYNQGPLKSSVKSPGLALRTDTWPSSALAACSV